MELEELKKYDLAYLLMLKASIINSRAELTDYLNMIEAAIGLKEIEKDGKINNAN